MVVHREGEGDQDGRLPAGGDLRDGGCAGPADQEIGRPVGRGHIRDERRDLGRKAPFAVGRGDGLPILFPRLMDEAEPVLHVPQVVQGLADEPVDRVRPLASAEDQDRETRVVLPSGGLSSRKAARIGFPVISVRLCRKPPLAMPGT